MLAIRFIWVLLYSLLDCKGRRLETTFSRLFCSPSSGLDLDSATELSAQELWDLEVRWRLSSCRSACWGGTVELYVFPVQMPPSRSALQIAVVEAVAVLRVAPAPARWLNCGSGGRRGRVLGNLNRPVVAPDFELSLANRVSTQFPVLTPFLREVSRMASVSKYLPSCLRCGAAISKLRATFITHRAV